MVFSGYDCSTPICVQAQSFVLNIDPNSPYRENLIALGGRGKDGKLACDDVKCPQYDGIVLVNNGRSFQTGCGYDPIITGCCYDRTSSAKAGIKFVCMQCQHEYSERASSWLQCLQNGIETHYYTRIDDIPKKFKARDGETIKLCGPEHNPGGSNGTEYYVSTDQIAKPNWSNRNYESNLTSDQFLCNRHSWVQGQYIDDTRLGIVKDISTDNEIEMGRHIRVNYNNYLYNQSTNKWIHGVTSAGEGIYACHNGGSCIAPDVCTCKDGYAGFDCKTPLCRHRQQNGQVVGCLNGGHCIEKDICKCIQTKSMLPQRFSQAEGGTTGWAGSDCSIPICTQGYFDPDCEDSTYGLGGEGCYRCANGGICVAPEVCKCTNGWSGFDCTSPVCVAEATPIIREQLMTDDEQMIRIFEIDPCAMKDFDSRLLPAHSKNEMMRGKCVLPNQCACTCHKQYSSPLCRFFRKDYCKLPFHDPWFHRRGVLSPNEIFGTRSCIAGFEGAVDEKDKFISCHLQIYEPPLFVEKTMFIIGWSICGFFVSGWLIIRISRRRHPYYTPASFKRKKS